MPTLLSIPQELRDQIIALCMISPTGYIETVRKTTAWKHNYPKALSSRSPRQYLQVSECESAAESAGAPWATKDFVTIALGRTCRQLYKETQKKFWKNNTFYFSSPSNFETETGHLHGGMGPLPRSLITSMRITPISPFDSFENSPLQKTMTTLTRQGNSEFHLKKVDLSLTVPELCFISLARAGLRASDIGRAFYNEALQIHYFKFLSILEAAARKNLFERTITLIGEGEILGPPEEIVATINDLCIAWGGPMYRGSTSLLEYYSQVEPQDGP